MKPNEIKAELVRRNIKLVDIADQAGCSVSQVSQCISGKRPYHNVRALIAQHLGKKIQQIFPSKKIKRSESVA